MSQYVFTLTSRMVAIAGTCVVMLCLLLFLLGVSLGKLWARSAAAVPAVSAPAQVLPPAVDQVPAAASQTLYR